MSGQRLDLGTKCQIRRTGLQGRVWLRNALGRGLGRCNGLVAAGVGVGGGGKSSQLVS